jgi:hypothetical protein
MHTRFLVILILPAIMIAGLIIPHVGDHSAVTRGDLCVVFALAILLSINALLIQVCRNQVLQTSMLASLLKAR